MLFDNFTLASERIFMRLVNWYYGYGLLSNDLTRQRASGKILLDLYERTITMTVKDLVPTFQLIVGEKTKDLDIESNKDAYRCTMAMLNSGATHGDRVKFAEGVANYFSKFPLKQADLVTIVIGDKKKTITSNLGQVKRIADIWVSMPLDVVWSGTRGGGRSQPKEVELIDASDLFD